MGRDNRWGFVPFIIVRTLQLLFAVIVMGLNANFISALLSAGLEAGWMFGFGLLVSIATLIWIIIVITLFFTSHLLPLAVVIVDAFSLFTWFIAMIGMGIANIDGTNLLTYDCSTCTLLDDAGDELCPLPAEMTLCELIKANFVFELLSLVLFIISLVFAGITLHRTKSDIRGKNHAQGSQYLEEVVLTQHAVPMQPVSVEHPVYQQQQSVQGGYFTQQQA